jgi:hypothetical protein
LCVLNTQKREFITTMAQRETERTDTRTTPGDEKRGRGGEMSMRRLFIGTFRTRTRRGQQKLTFGEQTINGARTDEDHHSKRADGGKVRSMNWFEGTHRRLGEN